MPNIPKGLRLLALVLLVDFTFKNVLEHYRPFKDDTSAAQPGSWIRANKTVEEAGGWKQYAKEAKPSPEPHKHAAPEPKK